MHVKKLHQESTIDHLSYDFWTQQYQLEETIQYAATYLLGHLKSADTMLDPDSLSLKILLQATIICLHQAVVAKLAKTRTSATAARAFKSGQQSMEAVVELSSIMRLVGRVNLSKVLPYLSYQNSIVPTFPIK